MTDDRPLRPANGSEFGEQTTPAREIKRHWRTPKDPQKDSK